MPEEINIDPLIKTLWQLDIKTYCPIIHPFLARKMIFTHYHHHTELINGKYNIKIPRFKANNTLAPWELDLIFTPLVGFDLKGNRLGMGAGFYDTSFAFRSNNKNAIFLLLVAPLTVKNQT